MAFGDRIKARREELALSRPQLADRLGVTPSTVSNYETGVSFPKEEMMLRLFDCLETDPNTLFQDSFRRGADVLTQRERQLLEQYRSLSPLGRESVQTMVEALRACQQESAAPEQEPRVIPLYRTPAAAGYAAPVFGEDFDYLQVTDGVPQAAEFAVRIQGDSMVPLHPGRLRGLCESRSPEGRGRGDLLRGRGYLLQAVLQGSRRNGVSFLPKPGAGRCGRGTHRRQRPDARLLRPGDPPRAAAAGADVTESRAPPMRRPALLFGSLQTMNPPSAARICPVRKDALSEARKATAWATSSGVPSRPRGVCSARSRKVSCPRT